MLLSLTFSSFNDKPINEGFVGPLGQELFEKEQNDLLSDLVDIPRKACDGRVQFFFHINFRLGHTNE
jgi:EH domain-containing protein 1